jgi:hypothetical protein
MTRLSNRSIPFSLSLWLILVLLAPCILAAERERPAIEAIVFHSFANDLVALMLPLVFTGVSSEAKSDIPLSLIDAVYCKTEDRGGVRNLLAFSIRESRWAVESRRCYERTIATGLLQQF